jgi:hypothetical protein
MLHEINALIADVEKWLNVGPGSQVATSLRFGAIPEKEMEIYRINKGIF